MIVYPIAVASDVFLIPLLSAMRFYVTVLLLSLLRSIHRVKLPYALNDNFEIWFATITLICIPATFSLLLSKHPVSPAHRRPDLATRAVPPQPARFLNRSAQSLETKRH